MCPHFSITIRQRSKHQSAVAGAAYQSGTKLFSEYDGKTKNYAYKSHEVVTSEILLPSHAPPEYKNRETLWNAVEKVEGQWNSQLARCLIIALPREIPAAEYPALVRDYCTEQFVKKGMIADFAIHDKGDGNPHVHIMLTLRALDENGKWLPKAKKVYDLDENGNRIPLPNGGYKSHKQNTVDWNDQKNAELWRSAWAEKVNSFLARYQIPERLDLRSYQRQEMEQVPTIHLGPAAAHLEKKGVQTELGDYNRAIKEHNRILASLRNSLKNLLAWIQKVRDAIKAEQEELEKKRREPYLIDYVYAYQDMYPNSRYDLLFAAKTYLWMQNTDIYTLGDLQSFAETYQDKLNRFRENEKKIHRMETTRKYIEIFETNRPVFSAYKRRMGKDKDNYAAAHKDSIEAFEKAVRYLNANKVPQTEKEVLPEKIRNLQSENDELQTVTLKKSFWIFLCYRKELRGFTSAKETVNALRYIIDTVRKAGIHPECSEYHEQLYKARKKKLSASKEEQTKHGKTHSYEMER